MQPDDEENLARFCGGEIPLTVKNLYMRWRRLWNKSDNAPCHPAVLCLIAAEAGVDADERDEPPAKPARFAGKGKRILDKKLEPAAAE